MPHDTDGDDQTAWARDFFTAVEPYQTGAYVNFLDRDDHGRVSAAFDQATYRRLVTVKDRYDPDNIFRHNHNIRPTRDQHALGAPADEALGPASRAALAPLSRPRS